MIVLKTITLVSVLITLSACGNLEWPPQSGGAGYGASQPGFVKGGGGASRRIKASSRFTNPGPPEQGLSGPFPGAAADREHLVAAGETLSKISQAYGVDVYQMAILNQLEPPFRIYAGQSLALPNSAGKPLQLAAFRRHDVIMEKEAFGPLFETPVLRAPDPLPTTNSLHVVPGVKPSAARKLVPSRHVSAL